jgi:hypothetical protein
MFSNKKMFLEKTPWYYFLVGSGIFSALYFYGVSALSLGDSPWRSAFCLVLLAGLTHLAVGALMTFRANYLFYPNKRAVIGSVLSAGLSSYVLVLAYYFLVARGLNLALFALVLMLGAAFGALYSGYTARRKLSTKQWLGAAGVALLGYSFFSGLETGLATNDTWFLLSAALALFLQTPLASKHGTVAAFSQWVHTFWVGIAQVIVGAFGLLAISGTSLFTTIQASSSEFVWMVIGLTLSWVLARFTQQRLFMVGGSILKKRFYVLLLTTALLFGVAGYWHAIEITNTYIIAALAGAASYLLLGEFSLTSNRKK